MTRVGVGQSEHGGEEGSKEEEKDRKKLHKQKERKRLRETVFVLDRERQTERQRQ